MTATDRPHLRTHAFAALLYGVTAAVFNWPLPLYLSNKVMGSVAGDAGVYIWNLWVFRHELLVHGRFPLFTREVLALSPPVDLSLHNYTLFADLLALPLLSWLDVTTVFNLVYFGLTVFTAWSMFALVRSLGVRVPEAWLAGLLFGFSPIFVARSTAHLSLAVAAPLPLFLWTIREGHRRGHWGFSALAGAISGWAAMWDPYFGIFCALTGAAYFGAAYLRVPRAPGSAWRGRRVIDTLIIVLVVVIALIVGTGGTDVRVLGQTLRLHSLYGPVLGLTLLAGGRWFVAYRPRVTFAGPPLAIVVQHVIVWSVSAGVVLLPVLYALGHSLMDGATLHGPIYWRSSPPGVDLLAPFVPNPSHAQFGEPWLRWLTARPNGFADNVASLSLVACIVLAVAAWRYRWRPQRRWTMLAVFFGSLSLGPFVHIAGINTYIPGPWAFLRYVPIVTATRMPGRYVIPLAMAFAVLFAFALSKMLRMHGRWRPILLGAIGAALVFELAPFPRPLYEAHVPEIYRIVAADPRDVRVLVLPLGFRSGEWSEGSFTSASLFHQTYHEKSMLGGYLSRISRAEMERQHESYNVSRLVSLSEGKSVTPAEHETARSRAPGFVSRARLGYVVMETAAMTPQLRDYATSVFQLAKVAESEGYELYVPQVGTTVASR